MLHACSEDLEVFNILTGCSPKNLMDSQLAAAYAGFGHSLSYQNLLKHLLQIDVPKDATRSDWLQRPLTESQISYAALDVIHLLDAYRKLETLLVDKPHRHWLQEDCDRLVQNTQLTPPSEMYKDVKRAWQLRSKQLAVLKAVCEYREIEARKRDIPRNRVIHKASLWLIARYMPDNISSLSSIQDMKPNMVRKDGKAILQVIEAAKALPSNQLPEPLPAPLPKTARDYGKLIKAWVQHKAAELDVPVELLLTSKLSNAFLRQWHNTGRFSLPETLTGWRAEELGKPLILALQEHKTR